MKEAKYAAVTLYRFGETRCSSRIIDAAAMYRSQLVVFELAIDSPNVNKAAPRRTTSFKRKPPEPESAGKPPRLFSQPGSEKRNVKVDKKVQTANTLPIDDSLDDKGLIAIRVAASSSTTPIKFDVACKLRKLYRQLIIGLVLTSPSIPLAS